MSNAAPQPVAAHILNSLTGLRLTKVAGLGGDWIVVRNPDVALQREEVIVLCDRDFGVGAVGLIQITTLNDDGIPLSFNAFDAHGLQLTDTTEPARVLAHLASSDAAQSGMQVSSVASPTTQHRVVVEPEFVSVATPSLPLSEVEATADQGSAGLVMIEGFESPAPTLSFADADHLIVAMLDDADQLAAVENFSRFSLEPPVEDVTSIGLIAVNNPLIIEGTGQLHLKVIGTQPESGLQQMLTPRFALAAVQAVQHWADLHELTTWQVHTPRGEVIVVADQTDPQMWWTGLSLTTVMNGTVGAN